eukprot:6473135-Amphidinium_carterae.1
MHFPVRWINHPETEVLWEAVRWIQHSRPRAVVLENVKGILTPTSASELSPGQLLMQKLADAEYSDVMPVEIDLALFHAVSRRRTHTHTLPSTCDLCPSLCFQSNSEMTTESPLNAKQKNTAFSSYLTQTQVA